MSLKYREKSAVSFHWRNFSWQTMNYATGGLVMIFLWVLLARFWPQEILGQFTIMYTWVSIYGLVAEFGIDFWVTKQTSINSSNAYPRNLIQFKVLSSLFLAIAFYISGVAFGLPALSFLFLLIGTWVLNIGSFFSCFLRGCNQLSSESKISLVRHLIFGFSSTLLVIYGFKLASISLMYLFSNVMMLFMTLLTVKKYRFRVCNIKVCMKKIISSSILVWLFYLFSSLSVKLDIAMLGFLDTEQSVAIYNSAAKIFEGGLLVATAFVLSQFPTLVSTYESHPNQYYALVKFNAKLVVKITLGIGILGGLTVGIFFTALFGPEYQSAQIPFLFLMFFLPLSCLCYFLSHGLIMAGLAKPVLKLMLIVTTSNLLLDHLLIPIAGITGVLITFFVKESILLVGLVVLVRKNLKLP